MNDPVQIWTLGNFTVADIAVPKFDGNKVGCQFLNCSQPNGVMAYYTNYCTGDQMLNVSRCVIEKFKDEGAGSYLVMMWSVGGKPDMNPQIRVREHSWHDPILNKDFSVYAVHTKSKLDDPPWNVCPANKGYASLSVLCYRKD